MAYDKQKIFEQAKERIIKRNGVVTKDFEL